ncbi:hypothetical protein E2C01_065312 [Portunus trituberculatus]|uniref:Uncharacterized protein n=1 Tax=Portunus trituberculatus TaxID=210409 RepID=A0A5B7HRC5_PORTR|nr:hypothetical protein [Portunus trituberculatus]
MRRDRLRQDEVMQDPPSLPPSNPQSRPAHSSGEGRPRPVSPAVSPAAPPATRQPGQIVACFLCTHVLLLALLNTSWP